MRQPIKERLSRYTQIDSETGCWNWTGYKDKDGYGNINIGRSPHQAHRVSYHEFKGFFDTTLQVRHTCDNPSCINPSHLVLGTHKDNMKDKKERNRVKGERHPRSKLTEKEILGIRESTLSQSQLARDMGLNQSFIGKVRNRVNWTHI